jgi:putative tricarboxylic transport membrane protein
MKLSDTLSGLLSLAFGLAVVAYATTFPPMPGQDVGPSLFPIVIGCGFALFGTVLAASGWRERPRRWVAFEEWVRRARLAFNFGLVVLAVIFYAAAVDVLGFFITAFAVLASLCAAFGVRGRWIVPLAITVTFAIHYGFYTLLRVPLPWGVLGGLAW